MVGCQALNTLHARLRNGEVVPKVSRTSSRVINGDLHFSKLPLPAVGQKRRDSELGGCAEQHWA